MYLRLAIEKIRGTTVRVQHELNVSAIKDSFPFNLSRVLGVLFVFFSFSLFHLISHATPSAIKMY